jgi:hypothetical protein
MDAQLKIQIANEFSQARIKHLAFKSKLRSYLYGANGDKEPLTDHTQCVLGKWIIKMASEYNLGHELQEVNFNHQHIHAVARKLIILYDKGQTSEARDGFVEIDEVASELIESLQTVEAKLNSPYFHW